MFEAEAVADQIVIEMAGVVRRIRGDSELARQMRNATQIFQTMLEKGRGDSERIAC